MRRAESTGRRVWTARLAGVTAAAAVTTMLVAGPASASCGSAEGTVRTTPAGDAVCGPPAPSPSPTTQQTSKPTPPPKHPAKTPPPPRARRVTAAPPARQAQPAAPLAGLVIAPPLLMPSPEPPTQTQPYAGMYYQATGVGLPVRPGGAGAYTLRVALTLALAAAGTAWLYQARVRGWMIGLENEH